jgi:hypothetical protein
VLRLKAEGRGSKVAARWRSARVPVLLLIGAGVLFAAGSREFTTSYSSDVGLYEHYARAALASPVFHSLPREYPALALGVFVVPLALPLTYSVGFSLLAATAGFALVLSSDGLPGWPGWSRRACYYLLMGTVAVVFARYDVFPALAAVLAVEGARKGKWGRAWTWAVAGGMLKLFPFLLLPGFLIVERMQTGKWAYRRVVAACVPVALITVAQLLVAPASVLSPLRYQLRRGFELSSLQGSVTFLLDPMHVHWIGGFGSIEVVGRDHLAISVVVTGLMLLSLGVVWALAGRGQLSVVAVSLSVLSIAVLSEKSFAPQYLIWLAPFWAYWPMRRGWVAVALLTTLIYPLLYGEAADFGPSYYLPTAMAVVRNVVLLAVTVAWLLEQLQLHREMRYNVTSEDVRAGRIVGALSNAQRATLKKM